ncbi:hypothetical protein D0Z07_1461 [Hyphodiscus hymeniophilus]|uniref:Uncharacterized protein n=1 Tax=Hyphodiscus hymeniophilus TaxID=353542 RepID=A0A9P6VR12_9HELO|nr:hypothetical protein D0Z07_1461 [Hyphodiscus hymeniophilus]
MEDTTQVPDQKPEFTSDFEEFETRDAGYEKRQRLARVVESVRFGLTVLALLAGLTILGTSADTLSVYNKTRSGSDFIISLWPAEFDIRPTTALIVCSAIIFLTSTIALVGMKVPTIRNNPFTHSTISFAAPTICLIAALIGTSFFYGVNASNTVNSLKSWSCQWSDISMNVQPHWGQLCKESKTALYLTVMCIPVEVLVLATTAWGTMSVNRPLVITERKGSPAMS